MQFTWLFAGTLIGLLSCYRLMIGTSWVYAGSIVALRMTPRVIYPAGINTQPPCVPRLAITLSLSESVARRFISLIWTVAYRRSTRIVFRGGRRDSPEFYKLYSPLKTTLVLGWFTDRWLGTILYVSDLTQDSPEEMIQSVVSSIRRRSGSTTLVKRPVA